jgi:hypothetical protein
VLTLRANDEKPPSVWGKPRWWIQTRVAGKHNGEIAVIRFTEETIPARARVGLALRPQDWTYPFFGGGLDRTVRLLSPRYTPSNVDWIIEAPGMRARVRPWATTLRTADGWKVLRRP